MSFLMPCRTKWYQKSFDINFFRVWPKICVLLPAYKDHKVLVTSKTAELVGWLMYENLRPGSTDKAEDTLCCDIWHILVTAGEQPTWHLETPTVQKICCIMLPFMVNRAVTNPHSWGRHSSVTNGKPAGHTEVCHFMCLWLMSASRPHTWKCVIFN